MADKTTYLENVRYNEVPSSGLFIIKSQIEIINDLFKNTKLSLMNGNQSAAISLVSESMFELFFDLFQTTETAGVNINISEDDLSLLSDEIEAVVETGDYALNFDGLYKLHDMCALAENLLFNAYLRGDSGDLTYVSWEFYSETLKANVYITPLIGSVVAAFIMKNNEFIPLCCINEAQ